MGLRHVHLQFGLKLKFAGLRREVSGSGEGMKTDMYTLIWSEVKNIIFGVNVFYFFFVEKLGGYLAKY
jgi:hypothetical protein